MTSALSKLKAVPLNLNYLFAGKPVADRRCLSTRTDQYDVCVIGSGPGGYVASIKAAQLGFKTACIEKYKNLGGTCLNVGCIPSKALLYNSHLYSMAKNGSLFARGIQCGHVDLNLAKLMENKTTAVSMLISGVEKLFSSNKVRRYLGTAKLESANTIRVTSSDPQEESLIQAKHIILATGSKVATIPGVEMNGINIISSNQAVNLKAVPRNMVVIGGGVIGVELGTVWSRLGANVTILEALGNVGGMNIDKEMADQMLRFVRRGGIDVKLLANVESIEGDQNSAEISVSYSQKQKSGQTISGDIVLVCIGRKPNTSGMNLEELGVKLDDRQRVIVDGNFETSLKGVFSIGDCIRGPMLAHKAEEEGVALAEYLHNGRQPHVDFNTVTSVVYTHPEVAWVGQTEEELKRDGVDYKVGKFPMMANSRSKAIGESEGLCKMLMDSATGKVLGCHLINFVAGDHIAQISLAMKHGLTCQQIAESCHAHPTFSEAIKEAACKAYCGKAINMIN